MTYDFKLFNDAGGLMVDGASPNYSLLASGTCSSGDRVYFSAADVPPLVFVRFNSSSQFVALRNISLTYVDIVVFGATAPRDQAFYRSQAGTVEYRIYGLAKSLSRSIGVIALQLWDAALNLIFDSNVPIPRVSQVVTCPPVTQVSQAFRQQTAVVAHSSGASPWMLANFTLNPYGYIYMQDYVQPTSDLLQPALRSTPDGRIEVAVVQFAQIGTQGSYWPSMNIQIPLMK